jgi:hypothetical protein
MVPQLSGKIVMARFGLRQRHQRENRLYFDELKEGSFVKYHKYQNSRIGFDTNATFVEDVVTDIAVAVYEVSTYVTLVGIIVPVPKVQRISGLGLLYRVTQFIVK